MVFSLLLNVENDWLDSIESVKKIILFMISFQHTKDFEDLVRTVVTMLNPEEQDRLREMEDWIIKGEGTWVLAEGFNAFLGRILHDKALPSEARVAMLRLFAYGCEQDDIVLILHMDRKDHLVMNYAQEFDRMPIKEQEAVALFVSSAKKPIHCKI